MRGGIEKYLAGHAEPEAAIADSATLGGDCTGVLVIPAFDEPAALVEELARLPEDLLTILVINNPPNKGACNERLFDALEFESSERFCMRHVPAPVLVVNRSTSPLPPRQGVGLARKIGADIALRLMANRQLPQTWIHSTDADAKLPAGYAHFAPPLDDPVAALVYPFVHDAPGRLGDAVQRYEIALHHYVLGLAHAGSPYAHHTIGSTLAVHPVHYAVARGFPRRAAGEDFYLINKLAKLGEVRQLASPQITVSGRASTRVPVGTGPNVARIDALQDPAQEYRYYSPLAFRALADVLRRLASLADPSHPAPPPERSRLPAATREAVDAWWQTVDAAAVLERSNARTVTQRQRLLTEWFDGFRTMRFIHTMRDAGLASVPLADLARAWGIDSSSDPQPLLRRLRRACFEEWSVGQLSGRDVYGNG